MCQEFHTTTRQLSERFFTELSRHNYVTPTSYLELINTFKALLDKKRMLVAWESGKGGWEGWMEVGRDGDVKVVDLAKIIWGRLI